MGIKKYLAFFLVFLGLITARAQKPGGKEVIGYDSTLTSLGPTVNTRFAELRPVISPDGLTLYFARQYHPKNKGGQTDEQDVWYSNALGKGQFQRWTEAKNIGRPINNIDANGVCSVTPDGNSLLLINAYNYDGTITPGGASLSTRTRTGWSQPTKLNILNYYNNDKNNVDYFLANSGKILLMAVARKDSEGGLDIYVSFLQKFGVWSQPLSLGKQVNSKAADFAPFLASDEKTLYFASEGHKGFGKSDIFYCKRLDDTWQNWTAPANLGPTVNTPFWDAYYTVSAAGQQAFLVSAKNGIQGSRDIFRIDVKEKFKPEAVILVKGRVLDSRTMKPIDAKIIYESILDGKEIGTARTNPEDGTYTIVLPSGIKYGYRAEAAGYIAMNENIDATNVKKYSEETKDLVLLPKEVGVKIKLNHIYFDQGKYTLQEASYAELNRLVQILKENPTLEIEVQGHTDSQGDAKANFELSEERVIEVKKYLVNKGVERKRVATRGFGETKFEYNNATEENRKLNRRVEFVITKK